MRLWSLHPHYLDPQGIVAVWREGLLAKKVLEGNTKGYRHHPQLIRFANYTKPLEAIQAYLYWIYEEAKRRGYQFSADKIEANPLVALIPVTFGQLQYEFEHLLKKVYIRNRVWYQELSHKKKDIQCNPVFYCIEGDSEPWEKNH